METGTNHEEEKEQEVCKILEALVNHVENGGMPLKRDKKKKERESNDANGEEEDEEEAESTCPPTPPPHSPPSAYPTQSAPVPLKKERRSPAERFTTEYVQAFVECKRSRPYVDDKAELRAVQEYYSQLCPATDQGETSGGERAFARALWQLESVRDTSSVSLKTLCPEKVGGPKCGARSYHALNALLCGTFQHAKRRIPLWAIVDRQQDGSLRCAYSNDLIETAQCQRLQKADEEHIVPQSWHRGSKLHPGTDMHQIFVVSKGANGSRGNYLFGIGQEEGAVRKTGGIVSRTTAAAGGNGGAVCEHDKKTVKQELFCPHFNVGAVCRATLYVLVAYQNSFHREYFSSEQMNFLIETCVANPPTDWERHRNQELFALQKNRNPFVDFPQWALEIEFSGAFQGFEMRGGRK